MMKADRKGVRQNRGGCRVLAVGCAAVALLLLGAGLVLVAFRGLPPIPAGLSSVLATSPPATAEAPDEQPATPAIPDEQAATPAVPDESTPSQLPGRIVFVNPQGQIGAVAPDGQDRRLLTEDGHRFIFPAWSPAGDRIAAIGGDTLETGVYTLPDAPEADVTTLYASSTFSPIYLYWSPDGRHVSFIAQTEEALGLYLAPAGGDADSRLLHTGQPFYWHWLAGGDQLLVHTNGSAPDARLAFLDIDDARLRDNLGQPGYFQAPAISAGEEYVAFAEVSAGNERQVVIQNRSGETVQQLPHFGAVALGWNPAEDVLAYISPSPDDRQALLNFYGPLRLADVATGEVATLASGAVIAFFWSPDGRSIAYFTLSGAGSEFNAALSGEGRFLRRAGQAQQQGPPRLSLWLADVESGQSQLLLTFEPTTVFLRQFLPFFDQYALSHRLWSPDSRALVVPLVEAETDRLYVIPIDRREIWPIAEGSVGFWSPE